MEKERVKIPLYISYGIEKADRKTKRQVKLTS